MKKQLILSFIVALISSQAMSQVKFGLNFSPGLAINRVTQPDDTTRTYDPKGVGFKFVAGPDIYIFLGDNVAVTTGIWYAAKRAGISIDSISGKKEDIYNLQYLQLPLGLRLFTNEFVTNMRLYFQVGSTFDIKLAEKEKAEKITQDAIQKFSRFDASILASVGVDFKIGENTSLMGGFRYNRGLLNAVSKQLPTLSDFKLNNDLILMDIGIRF